MITITWAGSTTETVSLVLGLRFNIKSKMLNLLWHCRLHYIKHFHIIVFYSYNRPLQNQSSDYCHFYCYAHPITLMSKMRTKMFKRVWGIRTNDLISQTPRFLPTVVIKYESMYWTHCMSGTALFICSALMTILKCRYYYYFHLTDEVQRCSVNCLYNHTASGERGA